MTEAVVDAVVARQRRVADARTAMRPLKSVKDSWKRGAMGNAWKGAHHGDLEQRAKRTSHAATTSATLFECRGGGGGVRREGYGR